MPPLRSSLAALVLVLATLLALPGFAGAQGTASESLASRVASQLESSPVAVAPPYDAVITPTARRKLVREIRATDRPILMALVPLVEGDQFDGEASPFVATLRDRLDRDGIYVAVQDRYLRAIEYRSGRMHFDETVEQALTLANYAGKDTAYDRTLLERAELFLGSLQLPPAELGKRIAAFEDERDAQAAQLPRAARGPSAEDDSATGLWVLIGVAIVLVVGFGLRRRQRGKGARPAADALPVLPDRVFEHARAAQRADLRDDADQELLNLSALLDRQPAPKRPAAQDAYQRALDAYAAARRRTGPEARTVDLVGALVLVDHARHDLASAAAIDADRRAPERPALCVFDPLHGRAARQVHWQHEGRRLDVPACRACADAVRRGSAPDTLRDGDQPYFEGDTVWARTGFGMFSDDLVARVSRGER